MTDEEQKRLDRDASRGKCVCCGGDVSVDKSQEGSDQIISPKPES
jgi:hypothetical protein